MYAEPEGEFDTRIGMTRVDHATPEPPEELFPMAAAAPATLVPCPFTSLT